MTDSQRAAMQAALEALERSRAYVYETDRPQIDGSMDALRAALVEAREAEPPYRFDRYINGRLMAEGVVIERETTLTAAISVAARLASTGANGEAPVLVLVASPPPRREWVGLTDEDINAAWKNCDPHRLLPSFAIAIEDVLKEKNSKHA